ncbi:MAG: right-handed parallel beta-helix repeat-containing protein [Methylobacter sp.]
MNESYLDFKLLSIQNNEKVLSTAKHFPTTSPFDVPHAVSHRGTQLVIKCSNPIKKKKNFICKLFFISCIQGLVGFQQAYAATYYVSPTGSDSNNGTSLSSAVKTINNALRKARSSGDIVYVTTGTYTEAVSISQSGITLSAYQNDKPVIDGGTSLPGRDWGTLIDVAGTSNTISGFEVRNSNINGANAGGYGIGVGGKNNTISNMNVHHTWSNGILVDGDQNTVQDSTVWQAVQENYQGHSPSWAMGLSTTGAYTTLRRNTVYNNWGEGIACFATDHCTMEDNVSYDNWTINLYIGDLTNSLIQRNMVYVSSNPAIAFKDSRHIGLFLDDEQPQANRSSGNTIINNMFYNADFNVFNWTIVNSGLVNTLIANNTIVDGGLSTGAGSSGGYIANSNSQIRNNIVIGQNSSVPSNSGITFSHNNWSMNPPSAAAASTNIIGDPHVARTGSTAPGALTSAYFKILGSSPVINAAMPLTNVPTDFFQVSRGTAPDIGGHEFQ